jgi:hypothetical protein
MKRNLTLQLDEITINRARVVAARRSMSISRLVSEEIERAAEKDDYWQIAKKVALTQLRKPFHLGGGTLPSRETLHQR